MLFRIFAALLFAGALLSAGCYGAAETDAVAYIMVLGIDKAQDGKQKVTFQTALPRTLSAGSEDGKNAAPQQTWSTTTFTIPTPAEARMLLNSTISRQAKSNHIIAYVFSEEVARQGIGPSLAYAIRNRDYRETIYILVVQGSAEEYLKQNKPKLQYTITRFFESFLLTNKGSYYLPSSFHQFYTRLKNNGGSPYMTYTSINPMTGADNPEPKSSPKQKSAPYLPGDIPRTGDANPIEMLGLAAFRGDKMVGILDNDETMAVAILEGKFPYSLVDVVDPLAPEKDSVNLKVRTEQAPKVKVSYINNIPVFDILVNIEAEILGISSGINYEALNFRPLLETQVAHMFEEQIMRMLKHTQALGTDPAGLGIYLRQNYGSTAEVDRLDTINLYESANFTVKVNTNIRRTGLLWRTTPIKKE